MQLLPFNYSCQLIFGKQVSYHLFRFFFSSNNNNPWTVGWVTFTNEKEQMLPRRRSTLTHGIQIPILSLYLIFKEFLGDFITFI